jgi:hypothetical protein
MALAKIQEALVPSVADEHVDLILDRASQLSNKRDPE